MNRRGFLKIIGTVPVCLPAIAAGAATAGVPGGGMVAIGGLDWSSTFDVRWTDWSTPKTLSESVGESVSEINSLLSRAATAGDRAQSTINKLTDFAIDHVDKIARLAAPVEQQMAEHDLFHPEEYRSQT